MPVLGNDKAFRNFVKKQDKCFMETQQNVDVWNTDTTAKKHLTRDAKIAFQRFLCKPPSRSLQIQGLNGVILVHRQKSSVTACHASKEVDKTLSADNNPLAAGKLTNVDSAHLGLRGDYHIGLYSTKESINLYSCGGKEWKILAQPALKEISYLATHLNPQALGKIETVNTDENVLRVVGHKQQNKPRPVARCFFAVALHPGHEEDKTIHQDWMDTIELVNAAMAYAKKYQTTWLVVW
ncbi:hypothetical protein EDC01DRAFT_626449 [Geopyxis carbonaria]|nr:hypothetical protein EDC01DRAFT_626449 [Geopyxis carbonaria]